MPRDMEMELKSVVKIFSYAAANYKKVNSMRKVAVIALSSNLDKIKYQISVVLCLISCFIA